MPRIARSPAAPAVAAAWAAGACLAGGAAAQQFVVSSAAGLRLQPAPWHRQPVDQGNDAEVIIRPDDPRQNIMGFGGAFTEASALNFRGLGRDVQEHLLEMYFGMSGHRLTIGRIPINSCDFSATSYSFDEVPDDFEMVHFDRHINRDRATGMVDMITRAVAKVEATGQKLKLFGSPWSPPRWMKAGDHPMVGSRLACLKSDKRYHAAWAKYLSTWISSYQAAGMDIFAITVQNEPGFYSNNGWEACSFTPEAERDFVRDHLGPQLTRDFGWNAKKIIAFDWNKHDLTYWADIILADPAAAQYIWGFGLHWYSGDLFNQLGMTAGKYPSKPLLATEGCSCMYDLSMYGTEWARAVRYAHDIIGDFSNGVIGWTDWNLLLDIESDTGAGGPNHAGNLCFAQVHTSAGQLRPTMSFYAFGQFSRYLLPGSLVLGHELRGLGGLEALSVRRTDHSYAVVLINHNNRPVSVGVQVAGEATGVKVGINLPPLSIGTVTFPKPTPAEQILT